MPCFQIDLESESRTFKTNLILSLILLLNLRLGGYSPYGVRFSSHYHTEDYLGLEQLIGLMQSRKYSKTPSKHSMPAIFDYKEIGCLSNLGSRIARRHRIFQDKGWHMDHILDHCNYSNTSRTSRNKRKLLD